MQLPKTENPAISVEQTTAAHKPGKTTTFSAFNQTFYSKFSSLDVFDCQEFNLLKVTQDGLKVKYAPFREMYLKGTGLRFFYLVRALVRRRSAFLSDWKAFRKYRSLKAVKKPIVLVEDRREGTLSENGRYVSVFFDQIRKLLRPDEYHFLGNKPDPANEVYDFGVHKLKDNFFWGINRSHLKLRQDLFATLDRIQKKTSFTATELRQAQAAFHIFWEQFVMWDLMLSKFPGNHAFFVQHYHNEGLVLALKKAGMSATELQHGLISAKDIFYVYPKNVAPCRDRMLFGDKILVFGRYWKEVLLKGAEYPEDKIVVTGDFMGRDESMDVNLPMSYRHRILVTGQTALTGHFVNYIQALVKDIKARGGNALVVYKPHPNEKEQDYETLFKTEGVQVVRDALYPLFQWATVHISIYSTTLFEASRFNLKNYALWVDMCSDYVQDIVGSGVAARIDMGENPLDKQPAGNSKTADYFFAPFDPSLVNGLLHTGDFR